MVGQGLRGQTTLATPTSGRHLILQAKFGECQKIETQAKREMGNGRRGDTGALPKAQINFVHKLCTVKFCVPVTTPNSLK